MNIFHQFLVMVLVKPLRVVSRVTRQDRFLELLETDVDIGTKNVCVMK